MSNRNRTDPRTEAERARIARARSKTARRIAHQTADVAELMFRILVERGTMSLDERGVALAALDHALASKTLPPMRRRSFEQYRAALEAGRRIKVATHPVEIHVAPFISPMPRPNEMFAGNATSET